MMNAEERRKRDEWVPLVEGADVVIGVDRDYPHGESLYYGRELLHLIHDSGFESPTKVVRIDIDNVNDPELLAAVVQVVKGSHDLLGEDGKPIWPPV